MTTTERGSDVRFTSGVEFDSKIIGTNAVGQAATTSLPAGRPARDNRILSADHMYLLRVTTHGSLVLWDSMDNRQVEVPASLEVLAAAKELHLRNPEGVKVKQVAWQGKIVAIREDNDTN